MPNWRKRHDPDKRFHLAGVLALLSVGLFQVKYSVQGKEAELRQITRQIDANREAIHVMEAEWSYLNDPLRLADLARRHTDLVPAMSTQIATFDQLPARPPLAPPTPEGAGCQHAPRNRRRRL